jgi:pimeloyl-ACP methyl ester carboxylesterase
MAATAIKHSYVTLSHGKTRYIDIGTGPPIILLHGSGIEQGADDWLHCLPVLSQEFRVLAPDLIGWPPSDSFPDIASFPYLVDFVREFQDALGIRRSHIVGASMGAWVAGLFAYESRERVDRVVVTGNPGFVGGANPHISEWHAPSDDVIRTWVLDVTRDTGVDGEALVEEKLRKVHEPGVLEAFARIMGHMGNPPNRSRYALMRRLPHITATTLFLFGKSDASVKYGEQARDATPDGHLLVLEAGHRLHIEIPEEFSRAVAAFLR